MIALVALAALAADPVAVAVAVRGDVAIEAGAEVRRSLAPFEKLRDGDLLHLGADAGLDLVWLDGGGVESLSGPAVVHVRVAVEPSPATGPPIADALGGLAERVSGAAILRGGAAPPDADRRREDALRAYADLRAARPEPDPLPELWLAATFATLELPDDFARALAAAAERCPACADVAVLGAMLEPVDARWCATRARAAVRALRRDPEEAWADARAAGLRCASSGLAPATPPDDERGRLRAVALGSDGQRPRHSADPSTR